MSEHTKEPWKDPKTPIPYIYGPNGERICRMNPAKTCRTDLRRIVACVNACVGVPTEALEQAGECAVHGVIPTLAAQYKFERDAAIQVLKSLIAEYDSVDSYDDLNLLQIIYNAQDVIRKATP